MSTDEERAWVLRKIASGGYSPWDDQDGSTANTLYEMAEALAPIIRPPVRKKQRPLYRLYLRLKLRAKLRWLGLVP